MPRGILSGSGAGSALCPSPSGIYHSPLPLPLRLGSRCADGDLSERKSRGKPARERPPLPPPPAPRGQAGGRGGARARGGAAAAGPGGGGPSRAQREGGRARGMVPAARRSAERSGRGAVACGAETCGSACALPRRHGPPPPAAAAAATAASPAAALRCPRRRRASERPPRQRRWAAARPGPTGDAWLGDPLSALPFFSPVSYIFFSSLSFCWFYLFIYFRPLKVVLGSSGSSPRDRRALSRLALWQRGRVPTHSRSGAAAARCGAGAAVGGAAAPYPFPEESWRGKGSLCRPPALHWWGALGVAAGRCAAKRRSARGRGGEQDGRRGGEGARDIWRWGRQRSPGAGGAGAP